MNFKRATWAAILALGAFLGVTTSEAQQPGTMARVGYLWLGPAPTPATPNVPFQAFRDGLRELGYVEGRNIVIESRWADGRTDRLPALAAELVGLKVDVFVGVGAAVARATRGATTTTPVVVAVVVDPVEGGLVAGLERPGGNLTGVTTFDPQEARKKLELLKEVVPGLARVALLGDQALQDPKGHAEHARALGLQPQRLAIAGASPALEEVFQAMRRERADALVVLEQPATATHRRRIAEMAAAQRIPALFPARSDADGLIGYGTNVAEPSRRLATYVDRILKGAKPADLPFEVIVRPEVIVNLKTAQEIGVTIPPEVLKRADRIVQ